MNRVALIKKHEGFRTKIYKDTLGNLTVGYGHALLEGSSMPVDVLDRLFEFDYFNAVATASKLCSEHRVILNDARFAVIIDMSFNLGYDKLSRFYATWNAIRSCDYKKAAEQMLNSRWASQVGRRAKTLATMMETGEWPNE